MFTKGEWKASHPLYGATDVIVDVTPQRTDMLASIKWGSNIPESEQRANAQLIASAPDMYEVLKEIATLKPANFYNSRLATNLANMALAKVGK